MPNSYPVDWAGPADLNWGKDVGGLLRQALEARRASQLAEQERQRLAEQENYRRQQDSIQNERMSKALDFQAETMKHTAARARVDQQEAALKARSFVEADALRRGDDALSGMARQDFSVDPTLAQNDQGQQEFFDTGVDSTPAQEPQFQLPAVPSIDEGAAPVLPEENRGLIGTALARQAAVRRAKEQEMADYEAKKSIDKEYAPGQRPVSVPKGGRLVDPTTGRVIYTDSSQPDATSVFPDLVGDELMAQLNNQDRANVQGLIDGTVDPRALASMRNDRREYLTGLARRVDSSFNMADYPTRVKTRQDFAVGAAGRNVRSLNTVIGHLDDLSKKSDALGNASWQTWNRVRNFGLTEAGSPEVTNFEKSANAVVSELATLFKGTGGTDQEIKAWRETINSSQSPKQLQDGIQALVSLVESRMNALGDQYQKGMGKQMEHDELLSEKSREIWDRFQGSESRGGGITSQEEYDALPPGSRYMFNGKQGVKR
jgi:hypothetical protein